MNFAFISGLVDFIPEEFAGRRFHVIELPERSEETAMPMTTTQAEDHFARLVETMGADNGCPFEATDKQRRAGAAAVARMAAAGCAFPTSEVDAQRAMEDLDGVYWQLAAGEQEEVQQAFARFDGYADVNRLLNEVFDG